MMSGDANIPVRDSFNAGALPFLGQKLSTPMAFEPARVMRGADRFPLAARGAAGAATSTVGSEATGVGAAIDQATGAAGHDPASLTGPGPMVPSDEAEALLMARFRVCLPQAVSFFEAMLDEGS